MGKKRDLSDLKNKFDFNKIVDSIAGIVDSDNPLRDIDPSDDIGQKIKNISESLLAMQKVHSEQANELARVDQLLKAVFNDIELLRSESDDVASVDPVNTEAPSQAGADEVVSDAAHNDQAPDDESSTKA